MHTFPPLSLAVSLSVLNAIFAGEGYGAEAVDVWEVEEDIGEDCAVALYETGMGFHQKGWA